MSTRPRSGFNAIVLGAISILILVLSISPPVSGLRLRFDPEYSPPSESLTTSRKCIDHCCRLFLRGCVNRAVHWDRGCSLSREDRITDLKTCLAPRVHITFWARPFGGGVSFRSVNQLRAADTGVAVCNANTHTRSLTSLSCPHAPSHRSRLVHGVQPGSMVTHV